MGAVLAQAREKIARGGAVDATLILIPRHGYATTRTTVESIRRNTRRALRIIAVDIRAPQPARAYMAQQAADPQFVHLPIEHWVSRQSGRLLALELVDSEYVVFMDNNMRVEPGWLDALVGAAEETGAAVVSPLIVTHGGEIHFSGGTVQRRLGKVIRSHQQRKGTISAPYRDCKLKRVKLDFAESHCCFARTEAMRISGVLKEAMHNAQTLCYAGYALKKLHRQRLILEPNAVTSILPVGFGYDLDWICHSYMVPELIEGSYAQLTELMGKGPSNDLRPSLWWHGMHLRYVLHTMAQQERLTRQDLLRSDELPDRVAGYDRPPDPRVARDIEEHVMPFVHDRRPELEPLLRRWLH
jgi:hypothetical protein